MTLRFDPEPPQLAFESPSASDPTLGAAPVTDKVSGLAEGAIVGDTVRCPWHHACFSLRTGEALAAPALSPVACWTVERRGDQVHVVDKVERDPLAPT